MVCPPPWGLPAASPGSLAGCRKPAALYGQKALQTRVLTLMWMQARVPSLNEIGPTQQDLTLM